MSFVLVLQIRKKCVEVDDKLYTIVSISEESIAPAPLYFKFLYTMTVMLSI